MKKLASTKVEEPLADAWRKRRARVVCMNAAAAPPAIRWWGIRLTQNLEEAFISPVSVLSEADGKIYFPSLVLPPISIRPLSRKPVVEDTENLTSSTMYCQVISMSGPVRRHYQFGHEASVWHRRTAEVKYMCVTVSSNKIPYDGSSSWR